MREQLRYRESSTATPQMAGDAHLRRDVGERKGFGGVGDGGDEGHTEDR